MQNYSIVFMSEMVIDQQDIMFPGCLSVRPVFGLSVFHVSGLTIRLSIHLFLDYCTDISPGMVNYKVVLQITQCIYSCNSRTKLELLHQQTFF